MSIVQIALDTSTGVFSFDVSPVVSRAGVRAYFVTPCEKFIEEFILPLCQVPVHVFLRSQVADRGERREWLAVDKELVLSAAIWRGVGMAADSNHLPGAAAPAELHKHDWACRRICVRVEVEICIAKRSAGISFLTRDEMRNVLIVPPQPRLITSNRPDDTNFIFYSSTLMTLAAILYGLEVAKSEAPVEVGKDG